AERHRRRVEDLLLLVGIRAAGIAHERADHLIDPSGRTTAVATDQHKTAHAELHKTARQVNASRPRSRDPRQRAAVNLKEWIAIVVRGHGDRIVDARRGDDADDVAPGDDLSEVVMSGGGRSTASTQQYESERDAFLHVSFLPTSYPRADVE